MRFETLEPRNLLASDVDFPTCWVEFEQIGDWRRDVTLGIAETYELKAVNTHSTRAVEVSASAANLFGGVSSLEEASFGVFENSVVPADYDGTLDPGEEVTFVMRATPKFSNHASPEQPGTANGEVLAFFGGEGWIGGDFWENSMSGRIHVNIADANLDGEVGFDDFLVVAANFGKQVDSYFAGDFDLSGTVDFTDFLILSVHFGKDAPDPV